MLHAPRAIVTAMTAGNGDRVMGKRFRCRYCRRCGCRSFPRPRQSHRRCLQDIRAAVRAVHAELAVVVKHAVTHDGPDRRRLDSVPERIANRHRFDGGIAANADAVTATVRYVKILDQNSESTSEAGQPHTIHEKAADGAVSYGGIAQRKQRWTGGNAVNRT